MVRLMDYEMMWKNLKVKLQIALAEFWKEASSYHSTDYDTVLKWMKEMEDKDEWSGKGPF